MFFQDLNVFSRSKRSKAVDQPATNELWLQTSEISSAFYIVVGASGLYGAKAKFSNYGQTSVDVFAPGVQIYSSIDGSK